MARDIFTGTGDIFVSVKRRDCKNDEWILFGHRCDVGPDAFYVSILYTCYYRKIWPSQFMAG